MTIVRDRPRLEEDFNLWALDQAARLRAMASLRANEPIDWELLAEEVEELGRNDLRTAMSLVELILAHLLKLEHSTATEPRDHWAWEVARFRLQLEKVLTEAITAKITTDLAKRHADAVKLVRAGSREHEPDLAARLPEACPYSCEQITGDWWPERSSPA